MAFEFIKHHTRYLVSRLGKVLHLDMIYFVKGGFWLGLSYGVSALLSLLLAMAFTNLTSQEFYGQYQFITTVIFTMVIFSLPGFNTAVAQSVASGYDSSLRRAVLVRLRWSFLGSIALLASAAYFYFISPEDIWPIFIIAALFFPGFGFETYSSFLTGKKLFNIASKYQICSRLITVIALIAIVYLTKNLFAVVGTFLVCTAITNLYFYLKALSQARKDHVDHDLVHYGFHLSLIEIITIAAFNLDKILLTYFLGFDKLAIYTIAIALPEQVRGLLRLSLPLLIPKFALSKPVRIYQIRKHLLLALFLSIIIGIIGAIASPWLITFFFTEKYAESVLYAQLLFIQIAVVLPAYVLYALMQAQKRVRGLYWYNVMFGLTELVLFFALIPKFGILGAITSKILVVLFATGYLFYLGSHSR